jgi:5-oxoprolinase (ATP-hydrolysing)
MLEGVEIVLPSGTMLSPIFLRDPTRDPAVAIGNTETSQRVVDTLLRAFAVAACSQGTMNNTLLGTPTTTYYETVCGGAGATPMQAGRDAVHTHMTNTRITDPEVFEHGLPVRLWTFAIRQGSGGAGTYRGGNGVLRAWEALEPIELCVLGQHRAKGPYGMQGGESGAVGIETVYRASGDIERCTGSTATLLEPGDRFELKTPGGGGWGIAAKD